MNNNNARQNKSFKAEAKELVQEFVRHVTSISTVQRTLIPLLTAYTQNALNVPTLSPSLKKIIIKICNEYHRQTSFASLAFLTPPAQSAWTVLLPLTLEYMHYIQQQQYNLVMDCQLEHSLSHALKPEMRKLFKESEFESIGHLLRVCKSWKWDLENIVANGIGKVSSDNSDQDDSTTRTNGSKDDTKALEQALKDLRREVITINGRLLKPPARGGIKAFVKLLSEALVSPSGPIQNSQQNIPDEVAQQFKNYSSEAGLGELSSSVSCIRVVDSESELSSDGNYSDGSVTGYSDVGDDSDCSTAEFVRNGTKARRRKRKEYRPLARKRKFDISTIDALTSRLFVAAGRSQQGGDAFFVV